MGNELQETLLIVFFIIILSIAIIKAPSFLVNRETKERIIGLKNSKKIDRTINYILWMPFFLSILQWVLFRELAIFLNAVSISGTLLVLLLVIKYNRYSSTKILNSKEIYIKNIFNEEKFLTALSESLPRGEKDAEYGLDHIPYLLQNTNKKKRKYQRTARQFLILTVLFGFLFTIIVTISGYIILEEESIGTGKDIRKLRVNTEEIITSLSIVTFNNFKKSEKFKDLSDDIKRYFDSIRIEKPQTIYESESYLKGLSIAESLSREIVSFDQIDNSIDSLTRFIADIPLGKLREHLYDLRETLREIQEYQSNALFSLERSINSIDNTIPKIEEKINKEPSYISEILKRFLVSIFIISFLLAILRFLANQYKAAMKQLQVAEQEDLAIRKLYVALRTAGNDSGAKRLVLKSLAQEIAHTNYIQPDSTPDKTKGSSTNNISLQELISFLVKKNV